MDRWTISHGSIPAEAFNQLRASVGWKMVPEGCYDGAIANSIACVHAVADEKVIGFARLIGDRTMYIYVQDLIVATEFQGRGIGRSLLLALEEIVAAFPEARKQIGLIAETAVVPFYEKLGYTQSLPVSAYLSKNCSF